MQVPDLREVVLRIIVASRRTPSGCAVAAEQRLRRCLVALACNVPAAIKATSLPLLVSDAAHDKGSWPFRLPRPDPKLSELRTTGTGVASTSPQLRGRIRDSLCRSSRRMSYARSTATTGPAVASAFPRKWKGETTPDAGRHRGRATWLILPVVICLSQRLSHACASMNQFEL